MENNFQTTNQNQKSTYRINNKLLLTLMLILLILVVSLISFTSSKNTNNIKKSTPSPSVYIEQEVYFPENSTLSFKNAISPLQKTKPGKTITEETLKSYPGYLIKQDNQNQSEYSYKSDILNRPNIIVTDNNLKVIFERELTPIYTDIAGYTTVTEMKEKHGEPEKIATGSAFYSGIFAESHIFASKGFAYICNPNTDEVLEIHFFEPTTTEEYITKFGSDIKPEDTIQIENFSNN